MLLADKDIAYTVATGRSMLSAQRILHGHVFDLPQIYNNGVTIWDPKIQQLTLDNLLAPAEVSTVINMVLSQGITPFVNVINAQQHFIYHANTLHAVEKELIDKYFALTNATLLPLDLLPADSQVTNISMLGNAEVVTKLWQEANTYEGLIAYSGQALEGKHLRWMDVHHRHANKGSAVTNLKNQLGASKVICFGDGDNDLSMFALADESYAPKNAKDEIKKSATAVIGHNHKDGIAHFLRERFSL